MICIEESEYERMMEMIEDAFQQACGVWPKEGGHVEYDHGCLSTWEHIQSFLLENKRIEEKHCRRK